MSSQVLFVGELESVAQASRVEPLSTVREPEHELAASATNMFSAFRGGSRDFNSQPIVAPTKKPMRLISAYKKALKYDG